MILPKDMLVNIFTHCITLLLSNTCMWWIDGSCHTPLSPRTSLYMWMWVIMSHPWRFIVGLTHKTTWNTKREQPCHGNKQLITFQNYNWEPSLFQNVTLFYAQHLEYHNLRMRQWPQWVKRLSACKADILVFVIFTLVVFWLTKEATTFMDKTWK